MISNTTYNLTLELAKKPLRAIFGQTIKELGKQNPNIVVLDADLSSSTQTKLFGDAFPDRFFNVGIAEQNLIGLAKGLALSNKIAVVSGFTSFSIGRAWEIIRTAAHDKLPLKLCTTHAGLSNGRDGGSHQSVEDMALMATMPNTQIFCPVDLLEVEQMIPFIINQPGVCFLRMGREPLPWVWQKDYHFTPYRPDLLYESKPDNVDITIFSTGFMTAYMPKVAFELEQKNYSVRLVHFGMIKPIKKEAIEKYLKNSTTLITVEEHNIIAGFGAQIARIIGEIHPLPILTIGINDEFGQSGTVEELYDYYGLSPEKIVQQIIAFKIK